VKSEWIRGVARVRVPYLGYVRLVFSKVVLVQTDGPGLATAAESGVQHTPNPSLRASDNATVSRGT